jgi:hypothetical protein
MFKRTEAPKFERGDLVFTKKDNEKVIIMKVADPDDQRNSDLGLRYLVRGDGNKMFPLYEFELMTLDEYISSTQLR